MSFEVRKFFVSVRAEDLEARERFFQHLLVGSRNLYHSWFDVLTTVWVFVFLSAPSKGRVAIESIQLFRITNHNP